MRVREGCEIEWVVGTRASAACALAYVVRGSSLGLTWMKVVGVEIYFWEQVN